MGRPVIQTIFIDFGDVCATYDFHRFIKNFSHAAKVSRTDVEVVLLKERPGDKGYWDYSPLFEALECGEIGPVGFFHALTNMLHCAERIDYATFAQLWVDIFEGENKELDKLLFKLPQKKYLLSNTNTIVHGRYISDCTIVRNHFPTRDQRVLSYDVGAIKPNPLIYKIALARAKARPEESLFIDDVPGNIEAWRALGGVGIVYNAKTDPIEKLEGELRALGVLV